MMKKKLQCVGFIVAAPEGGVVFFFHRTLRSGRLRNRGRPNKSRHEAKRIKISLPQQKSDTRRWRIGAPDRDVRHARKTRHATAIGRSKAAALIRLQPPPPALLRPSLSRADTHTHPHTHTHWPCPFFWPSFGASKLRSVSFVFWILFPSDRNWRTFLHPSIEGSMNWNHAKWRWNRVKHKNANEFLFSPVLAECWWEFLVYCFDIFMKIRKNSRSHIP